MKRIRKIGIYQVINLSNNKCYIGQSIDIMTRWRQHRHYLNANKHSNTHLQNAWNKYGENEFAFRTLEIIEASDKETLKKQLDQREDYWIEYYESDKDEKGYNKQKSQQGTFSEAWHKKNNKRITKRVKNFFQHTQLQHLSKADRKKVVHNLIKYQDSHFISLRSKSNGVRVRLTNIETKELNEIYILINPLRVVEKEEYLQDNTGGTKVFRIEPDSSNIVETFSQFKDVLIKYPQISRKGLEGVLYAKSKNKQSIKGKIFVLENNYNPDHTYTVGKSTPVKQINSEGETVKTFPSIQFLLKQKPKLNESSLRTVLAKNLPTEVYCFQYLESPKKTFITRKSIYELDPSSNQIVNCFKTIDEILDTYPDLTKRGIQKVLYKDRNTIKGHCFSYSADSDLI